jgi:uncharacterized repeat protein (TIGR01451 family)
MRETGKKGRMAKQQIKKLRFLGSLALGIVGSLLLLLAQSPLQVELESISHDAATEQSPIAGMPFAPLDVDITIAEVVASGFDHPIQVTHAGDGSNRLFVVEQSGQVRIIKNGGVLPIPFLDLSGLISYGGERGLLGLAFHPNYENNGYFYVNYTRAVDGATIIARYTVSALNPDIANPNSALVILTVAQPYANHNGGQVLFGPRDGYLYIGMGDGGSGGDPLNHAQNNTTLLGAILRLDVDGGTPYAIPSGNPYVGRDGQDEIWAIGLRNPWRFSFDRETGDLYIGDVGQNLWEEIDYQAATKPGGVNFGWRCKEGTHTYSSNPPCNDPALLASLADPIVEYSHGEGRSVTGGFVYRGTLYPALVGRYFYADFVEGRIWSLYKIGSSPDTWSTPELELDTGLNISAFGEDETGELYVVDWGGGTIRHLADLNGPTPNLSTSSKQASSPSADPGEVVTYTIQMINTGGLVTETISLTDTVSAGLTYVPGSLQATHGAVNDAQSPVLSWQGTPNTRTITITYQIIATGDVTGSILNEAFITGPSIAPLTLTHALFIPRSVFTTTQQDFFFPGTQPEQLRANIPSSIDCDTCHSVPIYDKWRGSMMSQAGRDPLMWAALSTANVDMPGAGDYCLRCHIPKGWLEGRSHPADGSALQVEDISNGVACEVCHRMVDPIPSETDETVVIDLSVRAELTAPIPSGYVGSSSMIADPDDNRRGPFSFGPALSYHTAYQTDFLGQSSDAGTRSRLCGTCHNLDNPVLSWDEGRGQYWPNEMGIAAPEFADGVFFPIERTFDEWLNSEYAQSGVYAPRFAGSKPDGIVSACQDCHLLRTTGIAAEAAFNPFTRDCQTTGCLPEHTLVGGNTWTPQLLQDPDWRLSAEGESTYLHNTVLSAQDMLQKAAALTVTLVPSGTVKIATVRVINHTGHKLPTGYPEGRQMWINLRAFDAEDSLIYESGTYDPVTGQLHRDADIKVYEVKQGITPELAALLKQPSGESFHFILNNTIVKDNRIPPRGYTQAAFDRPGLRPVGATYVDGQYWDDTVYVLSPETEKVLVTLYYQTASKEYIDFLRANGGVDGAALGELWKSLRSSPEVVTSAWEPNHILYLPLILRYFS